MTSNRPINRNTLLKVVILGKKEVHPFNLSMKMFSFLFISGDGGIGKSCLMNRFVSNQFDENSFHTIGVEFLNKDIEIDGESFTLQVNYYCPSAAADPIS